MERDAGAGVSDVHHGGAPIDGISRPQPSAILLPPMSGTLMMSRAIVLQQCADSERRDNFCPSSFPDWFEPDGNILVRGMIKDGLLKEDEKWSRAGQIAVRLTEKGKAEYHAGTGVSDAHHHT